ncbi:hypothetical protein SCHPADRAFT_997073 [Schizopora paradoxa]|uniref:MYND-type domain-containing protein n=1 Tax=Schizopora paradoxa TaxID=27342 RepID=A0A0H2RPF3_9AGAM|nr:hypothetical protein SCHPADRAFT_997073 [Schizopora paradoxa]
MSKTTHRDTKGGKDALAMKVLTAARNGSSDAIMFVGRTLAKSKESITVEAVDALLCHFEESTPTFKPTEITFDLHRDPAYKKHIAALTGMSFLHCHEDAVWTEDLGLLMKTSWSDVFRWMEFLYASYSSKKPSALGNDDKELLPHLMMGSLLTFLAVQKEISPHFVTQTPGAIRMATQLWMREALVPVNSAQPKSLSSIKEGTLLIYLALGRDPTSQVLDEVVEGANTAGLGLSMPAAWQARFTSSFEAGGELGRDTGMLAEVLTRLTILEFPHPLQEDFLSHGTIPFIMDCLSATAARAFPDGRSLDPEIVDHILPAILPGFRFICCVFHVAFDVQWLLQAIDAGFLDLFVKCTPMFPVFDKQVKEVLLALFVESLMPSLIHLPVVLACADALKRLEDQNSTDSIQRSTPEVKRAWRLLVETVAKRLKISLASASQPFRRQFICDTCCKTDDASTFKLCAGCNKVAYCSKECQVKGWKERGHRLQCKALKKGEGVTGKELLKRSHTRAAVSSTQIDLFVRDVARAEAHERLEELRGMAGEHLPDVHIEDVGVIADYSEFPPVFEVFARLECIQAREARERGVVDESNDDLLPSSQEDCDDKILEAEEASVKFEVLIRRGTSKYGRNVEISKFWEGLGSVGLQLEHRSNELTVLEKMLNECNI